MRNSSASPVLQGEQQALDGRVPLKIEFYRGIKEIARFLGMHEQTVQSRLKAGLIPAKKDALGRWVLCMGVPAVAENRLPHSRQVNLPGRVVMREARLTTPQPGQTGPAGQRALSRNAKQAAGSQKRFCKAARVSGSLPGFMRLTASHDA